MNFFRLRIINTFFLFLIGIMLGYLIKEMLSQRGQNIYPLRYTPSYQTEQRLPDIPAAENNSGTPAGLKSAAQEPPEIQTATEPAGEDNETYVSPIREKERPSIAERPADPAPEPEKPPAGAGSQAGDAFFNNASFYTGRELEMDLQMIMAKRAPGGWRLNFVHTGAGKAIDYLYVDDSGLLGEKPDLRIGYFYRVKFSCHKGDAASGNTLLSITATGGKASWATGMSAVE